MFKLETVTVKENQEPTPLCHDTVEKVCDIILEITHRTRDKKKEIMAWRILYRLNMIEGQPRHIDDWEHAFMSALKIDGWSYGNIAYICDRSKAAIHAKLMGGPSHDELMAKLDNEQTND